MHNLSIAVRNFNDRVKQMNQTNSRQLTLTANEAQNLHSDIFVLLAMIAELQGRSEVEVSTPDISLDGGGFK